MTDAYPRPRPTGNPSRRPQSIARAAVPVRMRPKNAPTLPLRGGASECLKLSPERLRFFEPCRYIADHRNEADDATCRGRDRSDSELDRQRRAILSLGRHRQQFAVAVSALAACHHVVISFPMAGSQPLRDNEIERLSHRLRRAVAEDPLRPGIPEAYEALAIACHNGIRTCCQDRPADQFVSERGARCHAWSSRGFGACASRMTSAAVFSEDGLGATRNTSSSSFL